MAGLSCAVCRHADRKKIEKALLARQSLRSIAGQFGIGKNSVAHHAKQCLAGRVPYRQATQEAQHLQTIADKMRWLWQEASELYQTCKTEQDRREQRCTLTELRQQMALQAELSAPDDGRDQWVKLRECIWHALQPYPDALQAVMTAIAPLEEETALVDAGG